MTFSAPKGVRGRCCGALPHRYAGGQMSLYVPIKGKCTWWREFPNEEDRFDRSLKLGEKRVQCVCFVEGDSWQYMAKDVPANCPFSRRCRYHILVG